MSISNKFAVLYTLMQELLLVALYLFLQIQTL